MTAFSVVFVCTGNRARSPFAEALLRRALENDLVRVESRGTQDLGRMPALPQAVAVAARFGVDLQRVRAHALERQELVDADLVLGFEPEHVAAAVVDGGALRERTFTLAELAELLRTLGPRELEPRAAVALAHASRHGSPLSAPAVPDPLGGTDADFRKTFERIDRLVATVAVRVFGSGSSGSEPEAPVGRIRALLGGRRQSSGPG